MSLSAGEVRAKARELGADLVGIAAGAVLDAHPPDPARPQAPRAISEEDSKSVIVLAKHHLAGTSRLKAWDDRHKQYSAELVLSELEEISLKLVYFLEDRGFPALTIPPMHADPAEYRANGDTRGPLSLIHAAVEAGLGTLGLNLMLLTPQYGPRVLLAGVMTSAELEPDPRMTTPLCLGESCGRCLMACPGDAILHWGLDKGKCAPHASPYGYEYLMKHLEQIIGTEDRQEQVRLLTRTKESFMSWQSLLRGVGVYSGCTRCVDVCPVGEDYERHLKVIQEEIPESTEAKAARLRAMQQARERGERIEGLERSRRWIGEEA
ncbi:MAG: epoxyqueuosine reductase [Deltaproteobacteria bacterium]|nr:epoxyqueuosine reductase [Deltaproteobacteria bacterium]